MSVTGQQIVDDLRAEVVEPNPTFFSDARILALINKAQNKYVAKTRVLQSFAFTSTIQGQADYPMPADWLGSEKVFFNATTDGTTPNWRPLKATNLEKLGQERPNFLSSDTASQGTPTEYYVIGSTLYLSPRPSSNGSSDIFMFYESKPIQLSTLADTLSIDDSLYDGVYEYVLSKMWDQDNEETKADKAMLRFDKMIGDGFKWKNKRILDGKWKLDIQSFIPFGYSGNEGGASAGVNPLNQ